MSPLDPDDLGQFTGSVEFYRHGLVRWVVYTEGVQYLAENGGAYWLIDAIASHLASSAFKRAVAKDSRVGLLHFWNLAVHPDRTADLTARADSGVTPFITQKIPFTDFPLEEIDVWAADNGQVYTLMLPSEY